MAYNAEATLPAVLDRIPAPVRDRVAEIFVFDDASTDHTLEVARACQPRFRPGLLTVPPHPVNLMYGGNQQAGYRYAIDRGLDVVVLLHGDGQYAPEVMDDLLRPIEAGDADLVMGSRMLRAGDALAGRMPLYKYLGNRVLTRLQNALVGTHLSEFHSGYRAYSVAALRTIPLERLTSNWHFDTQIILAFLRRGYRVREVPIPTFYGDEICHVNGIPYAAHCIAESLAFAGARLRDRRAAREPAGVPRLAK